MMASYKIEHQVQKYSDESVSKCIKSSNKENILKSEERASRRESLHSSFDDSEIGEGIRVPSSLQMKF
jgi:hypothetical protein